MSTTIPRSVADHQSPPSGPANRAVSIIRYLAVVVLLTLASIVIHESGHFIVYKLGGYPVRLTLQSVQPVGTVDPRWNAVALAAGPILSVIAAIVCTALAQRHGNSFAWVTAAFTNATLRIFPATMELIRAVTAGHPFSDEDAVIAAMSKHVGPRVIGTALVLACYVGLSAVIARRYHFTNHRMLKATLVYLVSLAVGIAIVIVDEAIHS